MTDKDWMINWLKIENFKSIKNQKINCKRLNIFIGKPNVGKSNILEAVATLGACNSWDEKFLSEFIRYKRFANLFYDNDRKKNILVNSNLGYFFVRYYSNSIDSYEAINATSLELIDETDPSKKSNYNLDELKRSFIELKNKHKNIPEPSLQSYQTFINSEGKKIGHDYTENKFFGNIKKYEFKKNQNYTGKNAGFLVPPNGNNTITMLENNPTILDEVVDIFYSYGLQLLIDNELNELQVQKTVGNRVYKIPYSMCADTLQRYIFNLLAIKTNKNSVIILEEPEAHSFPTYISNIGEEIVKDKQNQYFIATHSPYLLKEFVETADREDLALFICDYKNYETIIKELSNEEIDNLIDTKADIFYNLRAFQNND